VSGQNGELPKRWVRATIDELCVLNPKHDNELPDETPVSFVPMAAVSNVLGAITEPQARTLGEVRKGYTHFADGDVIFAKITPCMENGKVASVRGMINGLACGTTEFYVFRSRGAVDQDFLFHFIRQESYRKAARATMQSGVGQARVPKEFVLNTKLPVPPLSEQRRIVAKIEALQERSRRAREELSEVGPLLEQFQQSVLAAAFRGDLTADWRAAHPHVEPASAHLQRIRAERRHRWEQAELAKYEAKGQKPPKNWQEKYQEPEPIDDSDLLELPRGWCWTSIDIVSEVVRGASPRPAGDPKYFDGDHTPWITVKEITKDDEIYLTNTTTYLTEAGRAESRFIPAGILLLTNSGATLGVPKITKIGGCINDGSVAIISVSGSFQLYLYFYLQSLTQSLRQINQGAAQPNLNTDLVRQIMVPIAPAAEQEEIIEKLNVALDIYLLLKREIPEILGEVDQLDQAILAKAFRGELVPQDPNDEPASVLLERIRGQRAQQAATTKRQKKTSPLQGGNKTGGTSSRRTPQQMTLAGVLIDKDQAMAQNS
jgi:type I restriction enzyme S subunit